MSNEKQTSARSGNRAALRAGVALGVFAAFVALLFYADPADLYLWIKALHIIAVISWMAAIFTCRGCSSTTPMHRPVRSNPKPSR